MTQPTHGSLQAARILLCGKRKLITATGHMDLIAIAQLIDDQTKVKQRLDACRIALGVAEGELRAEHGESAHLQPEWDGPLLTALREAVAG